jgi:tRNA 2-thiocytidine biosynthesis protein TtcA
MAYWQKEIRSLTGKAIHRYSLIQEGDRILVGVSGGKDSLTLLHLLHERSKRVPVHYELMPVYIDLGFGSEKADTLRNFFETKELPYHIEFTDIGRRANSSEIL